MKYAVIAFLYGVGLYVLIGVGIELFTIYQKHFDDLKTQIDIYNDR